MNSLSWMIYLANILPNMQVGISVFSLIAFGALAIGFLANGMNDDWSTAKKCLWSVPVPVTVFLLTMLIPSERTIYLIAASQTGEKIIADPATAEMMQDVRDIISGKLKEMKVKP